MTDARIICIVGMHRSGTSMIARLLNICGLELGPADRLLKGDKNNPLGHFEHRDFLDVDRKLLKLFHATWRSPPNLPQGWEDDPRLRPLLSQARALAANFPTDRSWGWKEPRASLLLPFWSKAIPSMRFLICLRNPLEVAQSLQMRNEIDIEHGAWLWYFYTLKTLRDTQQCARLFSFFDDYFESGEEEVRRVLAFCSLERAVLGSVIEAELRHHESGNDRLHDEPAIPAECKKLYLGLRSILALPDSRIQIPNGTKSAAISSGVDAFVAQFDEQAALRYLAKKRTLGNKILHFGQRLTRFFPAVPSLAVPCIYW